MEYEQNFERLGGIVFLEKYNNKVSIEYIQTLERTIGKKLPEDYKHFLLNYGLCTFGKDIEYDAIKDHQEYIIPGHEADATAMGGSTIDAFLGDNQNDKDKHYDLLEVYQYYQKDIPQYLLPILFDGAGNFVAIHLGEDNYEKVYFWNHEIGWNFEDESDTLTEEMKYGSLYLLAENFTAFLNVCQLTPEY